MYFNKTTERKKEAQIKISYHGAGNMAIQVVAFLQDNCLNE